MASFVDESIADQCNHRFALWSPIATRFSPLEVCALLGSSLAELTYLGNIDLNTLPTDDLEDPSGRGRYYNFWMMARIGLHRHLRMPLRSNTVADDWAMQIEDELQEFLEAECDGQVHLDAVKKFGRSILQSSNTSFFVVHSSGEEVSVTESRVRSCYAGAIIDISKSIVSLLWDESGSISVALQGGTKAWTS